MHKPSVPIIVLLLLTLALGTCGKAKQDTRDLQSPEPAPLRIGVWPSYPPMIFLQDGRYVGIEADFARDLAREWNRPLIFVPMKWEQLIPALMAGKIDLIMSGMTVTRARRMRIDFTEPYFTARLVAAMRAKDRERYASKESILRADGNVGVIPGTTADAFVQRNLPNARRIAIAEIRYAALEFKARRIDLFISDGPGVVWLVSENEADLAGFWKPLDEEPLAWGVRRGDKETLTSANRILARWKTDGTVDKILSRWLPYLDRIK